MRGFIFVVACFITLNLYAQPPETTEEFKKLPRDLQKAMVAGTQVETIEFDLVTVDVKNELLTVQGRTATPRKVHLVPHRHDKQPDFWVYEVVAELDPAPKGKPQVYTKSIKMTDFMGSKGIEVFGGCKIGKDVMPKAVRVITK